MVPLRRFRQLAEQHACGNTVIQQLADVATQPSELWELAAALLLRRPVSLNESRQHHVLLVRPLQLFGPFIKRALLRARFVRNGRYCRVRYGSSGLAADRLRTSGGRSWLGLRLVRALSA